MNKDLDYRCSDCGCSMNYPGTCPDCLVKNRPVPEKLVEDLKKERKGNG